MGLPPFYSKFTKKGVSRYVDTGGDEFNRTFILALIDFYPEPGIWLFGGIYQVLSRAATNQAHSYRVEGVPAEGELVGRLKIHFTRPGRVRSIRLETYFAQMTVSELLKEAYTGERFPGYEGISHDFGALEVIFRTHRPDWKAALENVKGVYLIVDKSNGRKYVGSAYGDAGVWARWSCYIGTGHGWNDELTSLIAREGVDYARQNFRISLLEYRPAKTDDRVIIEREGYWKEAPPVARTVWIQQELSAVAERRLTSRSTLTTASRCSAAAGHRERWAFCKQNLKPMDMLIEHKLNFLDTMANIGMLWWVSGIVFCASILAGCLLKREVIVSIPFFQLFCITVTVFFLTVVGFGVFMSYHATCLETDVDTLLKTMQHSDPTSRADFRVVKYGYLIGTTSFTLITACWIWLWCILVKDHRKTVRLPPSPAVSVPQHDS